MVAMNSSPCLMRMLWKPLTKAWDWLLSEALNARNICCSSQRAMQSTSDAILLIILIKEFKETLLNFFISCYTTSHVWEVTKGQWCMFLHNTLLVLCVKGWNSFTPVLLRFQMYLTSTNHCLVSALLPSALGSGFRPGAVAPEPRPDSGFS